MFTKKATVLLITSAMLTACGGGSSNSEGGTTPPPSSGGGDDSNAAVKAKSQGAVSQFGSIYVNGVKYTTGSASFSNDDNDSVSESDLDVGMYVQVAGEINDDGKTGDATSVFFSEQLKGHVSAINHSSGTLTALGQTVHFDGNTSFAGDLELDGIKLGDRIEVSGYFGADGSLNATRIEKNNQASELKVQGMLSNLNAAAQTFALGNVNVDFSGANFNGISASDLAANMMITVKANSSAALNSGVLSASSIHSVTDFSAGAEGEKGMLEGSISAFVSAEEFNLGEVKVLTNSSTSFTGGQSSDLENDAEIRVSGEFNADDALVAESITFEMDAETEFEGMVSAVTTSSLSLFGKTVLVTDTTKFEDESSASIRQFSLANIAVGDFVEVTAYSNANGDFVATVIEREDNDDNGTVELEGKVSATSNTSFELDGVTVQTSSDNTTFIDANGQVASQADFFAALEVGAEVEVEGQANNDVVVASYVELEARAEHDDDANYVDFVGQLALISDNSMTISDKQVRFDSNTEFTLMGEAYTFEQFALIAKLEDSIRVKGTLQSDGSIQADALMLNVESNSPTAKALAEVTLIGQGEAGANVTIVANQTVHYGAETEYVSSQGEIDQQTYATSSITWNGFKVKGVLRDDVIVAYYIEQVEPAPSENSLALKGEVSAAASGEITLAERVVAYSSGTNFTINGEAATEAEFAAAVKAGAFVEVASTLTVDSSGVESIQAVSIALEIE